MLPEGRRTHTDGGGVNRTQVRRMKVREGEEPNTTRAQGSEVSRDQTLCLIVLEWVRERKRMGQMCVF